MIQFIFVDMDGTFLDADKNVSEYSIDVIRRLKETKDIQFGIASGRALTSLMPVIRSLHLETIVDVVVANNGAEILDMKTQEVAHLPFVELEQIKEVMTTFKDWPKMTICFHNPDHLYATKETERILRIQKMNKEKQISDPLVDDSYEPSPRVTLLLERPVDEEYINEIRKVHFKGLKSYHSEEDVYEYVREETSKVKGIEAYVRTQDKGLEDVMVFGDGENDREMLAQCGWGVAMKNALTDIQDISDDITSYTNDEDGVARYLIDNIERFAN